MEEGDNIHSTGDEDRLNEAAVLQHVLAVHPTVITIGELVRELNSGDDAFSGRDAVERAVRDLTGVGLLHRSESFVLPSRAALRFDELLGE